MFKNFFKSRFIVTTLVIYFITALVIVAQSQEFEDMLVVTPSQDTAALVEWTLYRNPDYLPDWNLPQESYENFCKPNDQSEDYGVISSRNKADYLILPVTFGYNLGKVNSVLSGSYDESENQESFTYAYHPELIWSAMINDYLEKRRYVDLEEWANEWLSSRVVTEDATTANREIDPLIILAGRNEGKRRWWQSVEYSGFRIANFSADMTLLEQPHEKTAVPDAAGLGAIAVQDLNDDTNVSVGLATLCQLKRIDSEDGFIGLPVEPEILIRKYDLSVEENEPFKVSTKGIPTLAESE